MISVDHMLKGIPPVTKFLMGSSILIHFLAYIEVVNHFDLYFSPKLVFSQFQFWRLFTNILFFGEEGIFVFFQMMMFYRCTKRLEEHTFRNRTADFIYFLLMGTVLMTIYGTFAGFTTHSRCCLTMLLYLWSRYNQNVVLLVFGFVPMKAPYITWFFVLFDVLIGKSISYDIVGIAIAHTYFFFTEVYPKLPLSQGKHFIKTPAVLEKIVSYMNIKPSEALFIDDE